MLQPLRLPLTLTQPDLRPPQLVILPVSPSTAIAKPKRPSRTLPNMSPSHEDDGRTSVSPDETTPEALSLPLSKRRHHHEFLRRRDSTLVKLKTQPPTMITLIPPPTLPGVCTLTSSVAVPRFLLMFFRLFLSLLLRSPSSRAASPSCSNLLIAQESHRVFGTHRDVLVGQA